MTKTLLILLSFLLPACSHLEVRRENLRYALFNAILPELKRLASEPKASVKKVRKPLLSLFGLTLNTDGSARYDLKYLRDRGPPELRSWVEAFTPSRRRFDPSVRLRLSRDTLMLQVKIEW